MNNITDSEIDFIKKIDTTKYLINSIDTNNDFIYKKLVELYFNPQKTKEFINNLIKIANSKNNTDFDKIIYCLYTNFIKISKEQNRLNELNTILNDYDMFNLDKKRKLIFINEYINAIECTNIILIESNRDNKNKENINKENKKMLSALVLDLLNNNKQDVIDIIDIFLSQRQSYIFDNSESVICYMFADLIVKKLELEQEKIINKILKKFLPKNINKLNNIIEEIANKNPEKIEDLFKYITKYCIKHNIKQNILEKDIIVVLINKKPEVASYIMHHTVFELGLAEKKISLTSTKSKTLKQFLSNILNTYIDKNNNTFYDIAFEIINVCVSNKIGIDKLIQIFNELNKNNSSEKIMDFGQLLCETYISSYLLYKHQQDRNNLFNLGNLSFGFDDTLDDISINFEYLNEDIIKVINIALNKENNNKITKIEDLTLKEIKILFDKFINTKFKNTKNGVSSGSIRSMSFLQIFYSLTKNININENTTINEVLQNQNFKEKMDNFGYISIKNDTKIQNKKDFLDLLGLTKKDFGKPGLKVFYVAFSNHAVTIAIDTSKSYKDFIKDDEDVFTDIVMIDSSHTIKFYLNNSKIVPTGVKNFFIKVPTINDNYQENGTCWINASCACSAILNNCNSFNDIVENNKLKDSLEEKITEEIEEYYLEKVKKIENMEDYVFVGETKDNELVKININKEDIIQKYNQLIKNIERLKLCEKSLEEIKQKYAELGVNLVFEPVNKKHISRNTFDDMCENIKLEVMAGEKKGVIITLENVNLFKYKNGNLGDFYKPTIQYIFKDKNIEDINDEFLKDLEDKIKNNEIIGCDVRMFGNEKIDPNTITKKDKIIEFGDPTWANKVKEIIGDELKLKEEVKVENLNDSQQHTQEPDIKTEQELFSYIEKTSLEALGRNLIYKKDEKTDKITLSFTDIGKEKLLELNINTEILSEILEQFAIEIPEQIENYDAIKK